MSCLKASAKIKNRLIYIRFQDNHLNQQPLESSYLFVSVIKLNK